MRSLFMNPAKHEISLIFGGHLDDGVAEFSFEFGEIKGAYCISDTEAKRIGDWFVNLSKEIKRENTRRKKKAKVLND